MTALSVGLDGLIPRLTEVRHDIHRHPELGFEEVRTQAQVRAFLESCGLEPRVMAETGLVADIVNRPGEPFVALRADLDALPIHEKTELPYRSVHDGCSHKCGHDGHTAILLGVAAQLATHRHEIPGNVRLVFQPAEEGVRGGGARVMIEEGVLEGVREIYGLHNWPPFAKGEVRVAGGPAMAEVTNVEITVRGVGGHASQPQANKDPILAASLLVTQLQTIVSRNLAPLEGAVVGISTFHSGTVHNVTPSRADLTGTIRTFDDAVGERVRQRVRDLARGIADGFGVQVDLELKKLYPVLVNDHDCAEAVARVGRRVVGPERVGPEGVPITGAEDFSYYLRRVPGAYFFLGAGRPGESTPGCHHPDFDFDDDLIDVGVRMFLGLVEDRIGPPTEA